MTSPSSGNRPPMSAQEWIDRIALTDPGRAKALKAELRRGAMQAARRRAKAQGPDPKESQLPPSDRGDAHEPPEAA